MADLSVMNDLIAGVADAMDVFGKEIILRSFVLSGPSYNPVRTPVDVTVRGIQIDFEASDRDGVIISSNDTRYMIESNDINGAEVIANMSMQIIDDKTYNVKSIERIKPANTSILYIFHVGV